MSSSERIQSPLHQVLNEYGEGAGEFRNVALSELAQMGHFNLRVQPEDQDAQKLFEKLLGFSLPQNPNTFIVCNEILCAWLGPDEWLVIVPEYVVERTEQALREVATKGFVSLTDLSSAQTVIRVVGEGIRDFLSRGITIDLHPQRFSSGECAQALMARVPVLILNQHAEEATLDLIVRRSFADYLYRWMLDIGAEADFQPVDS